MPFNELPATTEIAIPPEILLQIIYWATYDRAFGLLTAPSWKNYDLSSHDPDDPWPSPSDRAKETARSIAQTNRQFRRLSMEYVYRHLDIQTMEQLRYLVAALRNHEPQLTEDVQWVRRLSFAMFKENIWKPEDTILLIEVILACPNLTVFVNEIVTGGELHQAGDVVLKAVVSRPQLRRLHWKPVGCMQLNASELSPLLSRAATLESLDIDAPPLPQASSVDEEYTYAPLISLKHLRICVNEDHAPLISEISKWPLPALEAIYVRSTRAASMDAVMRMLLTHGKVVRSLYLDSWASEDLPLSFILALCIPRLEELLIHEGDTEVYNVFPSIKTVVLCAKDMDNNFTMSRIIMRPLRHIQWVNKALFPDLEKIVIVSPKIDGLTQPHEADLPVYKPILSQYMKQWLDSGVEVVNRSGVKIVKD